MIFYFHNFKFDSNGLEKSMNIKIYSLVGALVIASFQIIFAIDPNHQLLTQQTVKLRNVKNIKISNSIIKSEKLKPIKYTPFSFEYFNIKPNEIVRLKNGRTLNANKFLEEVNEIEKNLMNGDIHLKMISERLYLVK